MSVRNIILLVVFAWVVLYFFIYYVLYSTTNVQSSEIIVGDSTRELKASGSTTGKSSIFSITQDPFTPSYCEELISSYSVTRAMASVIIPFRDGIKQDLLQTVQSVIDNSNGYLKEIVIVDDRSTQPVSEWSEWSSLFSDSKSMIKILYQSTQLGLAGAKHAGAIHATRDTASGSKEILIFLEPNVVVSANWISPLFNALADRPKSIVYPSIDVLDMSRSRVIKSSNVLGGFDWSFSFRWEDASKTERLFGAGNKKVVDEDTIATSPAAPSVFAITSNHYKFIGGLSKILHDSDIETVELSIRVWACGGSVIRQPCSRVAQRFFNLDNDYVKPLRKIEVDKAALEVAEQWLDGPHLEYVFMSRFTGTMPYKVDIPLDARSPIQVIMAPKLVDDKCASFNWYLTEVYPGLRSDMEEVATQYKIFLDSKYETRLLEPLVSQYSSKTVHEYNPAEKEKLEAHASIASELQISDIHRTREPPKPREKTLQDLVDEAHEVHADKVRQTFLCEDENIKGASKTCQVRHQNNECQTNKQYMIFGCPLTCGLCGTDKQLCVDFYEKKCLEWKEQGMCDSSPEETRHKCRLSCGVCSRADLKTVKSDTNGQEDEEEEVEDVTMPHIAISNELDNHNIAPIIPLAPIVPVSPVSTAADPYVAQRKFAEGSLPDPLVDNPCTVPTKADAKLLNIVSVVPLAESNPKNIKLFCGIYTMASNHETNVKATVSTWAKKCTGFMAFSTASDLSLPAFKIEHEGDEAYDNMWQKSKSIWKYISENYINDFDYFLMGGDDMFYIIENLFTYLNSDEIDTLRLAGSGQFIGRRFFPPMQEVFNSGGAGYLLDRAALKILKDNIDSAKCFPHQRGFWEDVNIANCLRVSNKILPYDTRDSLKRERFHPFTPGNHLTYRIPPVTPDWYAKYNPELKIGIDCCSNESVSFHYCPAPTLIQLHSYLYHCDNKV